MRSHNRPGLTVIQFEAAAPTTAMIATSDI
jgi:hypothetical protein